MEEQTATTQGTAPRCHCGSRTDHQCPRPATIARWGDGPPDICELHDRMWRLDDELGLHREARFWLGSWEEQAERLDCDPLAEAMGFARAQMDVVVARLEREMAAEEEDSAR